MNVAGWVPPTIALSLVFIALSFVAVAIALLLGMRRIDRQVQTLQQRLSPTIDAVNRLAGTGEDLGGRVREEVLAVLDTSRIVRRDVTRGVRRIQGRLQDLDALYEVVHEEVQDTALDVAAKLRTFRRGTSVIGRLRRLLVRGRR